MLVTDSGCKWRIWFIVKITNITKKVANIMQLPPSSEISHHHKVTNITISPTSISPDILVTGWLKVWEFCSILWELIQSVRWKQGHLGLNLILESSQLLKMSAQFHHQLLIWNRNNLNLIKSWSYKIFIPWLNNVILEWF